MPAWIATTRHIDVLVQAATRSDPVRAAPVLVRTARAGRRHARLRRLYADRRARPDAPRREHREPRVRYPDDTFDEPPGPTVKTAPEAYRYTYPGTFPIVAELKAIDCYAYLSCEHPQWRHSEAFAFCEALRHRLVMRVPGYDEAPWGID